MFDLYYRKPRLLVLTVAVIVAAGLAAYRTLPRMEEPRQRTRDALVTTHFPGADAERVESLVTKPIEDKLFEIEQLKSVQSTSQAGVSLVAILLKDEVTAVDDVWARVRDKLKDVKPVLPAGRASPQMHQIEGRAYALIVALNWEQDGPVSHAVLRRLTEELADELRAVAGTERVERHGDPREEITVEIDPARLAPLGLTAEEVARRVGLSDAKVSAGAVRHAGGDLLIEVHGELDSLERIGNTPLHHGSEGQFVLLRDVATIHKGVREPASDLALVHGRPAVALGVFVAGDRRLDRWAQAARDRLEAFRAQLPRGVGLQVLFDQSRYTEQRLDSLVQDLLLSAAGVVLVTFFMMGFRSALVVSVSLPLSTFMVLAGMALLGVPIHQMSVMGLVVALGLLIDNTIVIVDEVTQHLREGLAPAEAIERSVRHVAIPLFGCTLTTAIAFLPTVLTPIGEFIGAISIGVTLAVFSSLFLALTVIPALVGLFPARAHGTRRPRLWQTGFAHSGLAAAYNRALDWLLARPVWAVGLGLLVPVAGFVQSGKLVEQFFPPADRDMIHIEVELPGHAALARTQSDVLRLREQMLAHPGIKEVHWFVGKSAPSFYLTVIRKQDGGASFYAHAIVQLASAADSRSLIRALQAELDTALPEARVLVRQLELGPPTDAAVELRLYGPDLARLAELGDEVRTLFTQVPDVIHTDADLTEVLPTLSVRVDEQQARLAGLTRSSIARQLDGTLEGKVGGSLVEATEELPVRVRLARSAHGRPDRLASLELLPEAASSPAGPVPLAALGEVHLVPQTAAITHRNGRRVNTVGAHITAGVAPAQVLAAIRQRLAASDFTLPAGYTMEFGGEEEKRDEAVSYLAAWLGVLVVLMAATLVLSLGSFRLAGLVAVVAVLSIGWGLAALWVFGHPFGFMAIIGLMGMIGVAVDDAAVILAALHADAQARAGDPRAVRHVVVRSTRHVLATTVTVIASCLPLILGGGGFWPPLALTIAGGVTGATMMALLLVPPAYLLVFRAAGGPKGAVPSIAGRLRGAWAPAAVGDFSCEIPRPS